MTILLAYRDEDTEERSKEATGQSHQEIFVSEQEHREEHYDHHNNPKHDHFVDTDVALSILNYFLKHRHILQIIEYVHHEQDHVDGEGKVEQYLAHQYQDTVPEVVEGK